jgi:hypothetical protein
MNIIACSFGLRGASFLAIALSLLYLGTARADVIDSSAHGFTVKNTTHIGANADDVYRHLLEVGKWWNPSHTFSGNSENLSIETTANGCFCEKLEGGGTVRHLVVVFAAPGKTLRMAGALGPLQSMAVSGSLTWSLSKAENGTTLELMYTVGGYRPGGLQSLAPIVDKVLLNQLLRLKSYVERGTPDADSQRMK